MKKAITELDFDNLIDSKTGETVKVAVDDDFDMVSFESQRRSMKDTCNTINEAFSEVAADD